jgi:hypothetical protein
MILYQVIKPWLLLLKPPNSKPRGRPKLMHTGRHVRYPSQIIGNWHPAHIVQGDTESCNKTRALNTGCHKDYGLIDVSCQLLVSFIRIWQQHSGVWFAVLCFWDGTSVVGWWSYERGSRGTLLQMAMMILIRPCVFRTVWVALLPCT